jgi:hypothetical protein
MAKDKGNKSQESTYILSQADVDKIAGDVNESVRRRAEHRAGDQDQNLPDDLAARFDKLEQALTGEERTWATHDEVRAVVKKHAPNLIRVSENDEVEEVVLKVLNDLPNTTPEVVEEVLLAQIGEDFGKQMALQEALDDNEIPTMQQIEKFGKMFTKMIQAEESGEDPDMSEFRTAPSSFVDQAVEDYAANEPADTGDNLLRRLSRVKKLFDLCPTALRSNEPYRQLARPGRAVMAQPNIYTPSLFAEKRNYKGELDTDAIEKVMRRLDTEIRNLDPADREEFIFAFTDDILSTESALEKRNFYTNRGRVSQLSEESSKALNDLVELYFFAKHHYVASQKALDEVQREFSGKSIDRLLEVADNRIKPNLRGQNRMVYPEEYIDLLCLNKALYMALPDRFADTIHAAMQVDSTLDGDITSLQYNAALPEASKHLRNAFIALSQNRGSFETFFITLYRFYSILKKELNDKVETAFNMVNLYDHLNISIALALKESRARILEVPF